MTAPATTLARRVPATPATVQYGWFDPAADPVAHVAAGEPLTLVTVQGASTDDVPASWVPAEVRALEEGAPTRRGPGPHVVTGPVAVDGIAAGQRVAVHLDDVVLTSRYGFQRLRPGRGVLPDEVDELTEVVVELRDGHGLLPTPGGRVPVPLRPFPGIVATSPAREAGPLTTAEPGPHGGNLDCPELVSGSTVFLPSAVDGVGLSVGDGHAAQGEGEVGLTAVETCMDVTVRVESAEEVPPAPAPVATTPAGLVVTGMASTIDDALVAAVDAALEVLVAATGVDRRSAYRLCSVAGHVRISQAVCATRTVHLLLPGEVAAALPGRAAWLDHPGWTRRTGVC